MFAQELQVSSHNLHEWFFDDSFSILVQQIHHGWILLAGELVFAADSIGMESPGGISIGHLRDDQVLLARLVLSAQTWFLVLD